MASRAFAEPPERPSHLLRLSAATQTATQDVTAGRVIPTNRLLFRHSTVTTATTIDATTSTDLRQTEHH